MKFDDKIHKTLKKINTLQETTRQRQDNQKIFKSEVWQELHKILDKFILTLKAGDAALAHDDENLAVMIDTIDQLADMTTSLAGIDLKEPANIKLVLELAPLTNAKIAFKLLDKDNQDKWRMIINEG